MEDKDLFLMIKECKNYKTVGNDVDYCIMVNSSEKRIYLMFEESTSDTDWKVNFTFPSKVYKHQSEFYLVHKGYVDSWKSCNDEIIKDFIKTCNIAPTFTPTVIGWSYGGAMAQLAAEDFFFRTGTKPDLTTFGSPKILYGLFTKKHFKNSMNIVKEYKNINDFVTWCIPLPFVHHINKIKCNSKFNLLKIFKTEYNHTHYNEFI